MYLNGCLKYVKFFKDGIELRRTLISRHGWHSVYPILIRQVTSQIHPRTGTNRTVLPNEYYNSPKTFARSIKQPRKSGQAYHPMILHCLTSPSRKDLKKTSAVSEMLFRCVKGKRI
jgi:hypothetical protein